MTLPNRDVPPIPDMVSEVLPLLGDGASRGNAEAVIEWALTRFPVPVGPVMVGTLVGVNEVAIRLGVTRASVLRWANGQGRTDFPAPLAILACGSHWDLNTIEEWAKNASDSS